MNTVLKHIVSKSVQNCSWSHRLYQSSFSKSVSFALQIQRKMSGIALEKPKIIFVLGAPGSGKGTQCANIVDKYNYVHLSAGDLLRAERNRPGSELAQTIEEFIRAGRIIPVAITCSLIERAMNEQMQVSVLFRIFFFFFWLSIEKWKTKNEKWRWKNGKMDLKLLWIQSIWSLNSKTELKFW